MKSILIVVCVFALSYAIRVPPTWHNGLQHRKHLVNPLKHNKYSNKLLPYKFNKFHVLPHKHKFLKQNIRRKLVDFNNSPVGFQYLYTRPQNQFAEVSNRMNIWTPITPFSVNTNLGYGLPKPNLPVDLTQFPKQHFTQSASTYSPLHKNYRDDKTFENENDNDEYISDPSPEIQRPSEDTVKSVHENPLDIPTRPIYPGERNWARPGKKHEPFISEHTFTEKKETQEERPDGYEIFEAGEELLDKKRAEFEISRNRYKPKNENVDDSGEASEEEQEEESRNEKDVKEFVPMTLYTQVRRSGNEEHLPSDSEGSEGGRLKEVIKDSKIHTVYTEEGYEDSAYDHAGREKEAENSEGYSDYNKKEERKKEPLHSNNKEQSKDGDQDNEESSHILKTAESPNIDSSYYSKSKSKKHPTKNKNKLSKTKAIKTMELKENSDGTQMQITSEVKMMLSPNSGSSTQIIEIMPKVVKYFDVDSNKYNPEESPEKTSSSETPTSSKSLHREKRYTNDLPKIDVKGDFIKGIEKNDIPEYKIEIQQNKYPYYNDRHLNENSPLRYSENLDNIPVKTEGEMAFYEQANRIECPEVDSDLEAIPKRIQGVEEAINNGEKLEGSAESEGSPRLGKLGQRIDCMKRKYFGEDPLDSPFFRETEIGRVTPLFKNFERKTAGFQNHYKKPDQIQNPSNIQRGKSKKKYHSKFSMQEIQDKISEESVITANQNHLIVVDTAKPTISRLKYSIPNTDVQTDTEVIVPHQEISPSVEIINVNNFRSINQMTTDIPRVSQLTSPGRSTGVNPEPVYDQNELLAIIPSQNTQLPATFLGVENDRKAKLVEEGSNQAYQAAELRMNYRPNHYHIPLKPRQRNRARRPQQNFNINGYVTNQYGRIGSKLPNTYNIKGLSHYNKQTLPLEQLNVFSDVLNNIKNGTNDPIKAGIISYSVSNHMNGFYNSAAKTRIPTKKINVDLTKYLADQTPFQTELTTSSTTFSPTKKPRRGVFKYKATTEEEYYDDEIKEVDNNQIFGKKTISGKKSTSSTPDEMDVDSEVSESSTDTITNQNAGETISILGLVPPSKWQYRTIYQPVEELISDSKISGSETLNTYYVVGMKPPSTKHKTYDFDDFQKSMNGKSSNRFHNVKSRRGKRSANRKSYFEVVGNHRLDITETSTVDNDDDYVPHRPKNWHWDEKLKKIVYDKPKEEEKSNEDVEVVEIEVEDPLPKNIQQTSTRRIFTNTAPLNGPSYVDFIKMLKSNKNYVSIPDPTTTKKGIIIETTTTPTTTVTSEPTKPPEFLNILSRLRQSDSYVQIKDKNVTKTKTTTTEVSPKQEEEYIDDSETALSNIQNSPGKGAVDIGHNLKIFDVNDFLPRVKSYSPRTAIDYSKYKTIRRTPSRSTTVPTEENEENVRNVATTAKTSSDEEAFTANTQKKVEIIELSREKFPTAEQVTTTVPSTTIRIQRIRGRRPTRSSTPASVTSTTVSNKEVVFVTASKPKRVYPRRRYPHIRTRTTTEKQGEGLNLNESLRNVRRRHNFDESHEGETKIISLETLILLDQLNQTGNNNSSQKLVESSPSTTNVQNVSGSKNVSVDDILKNINQLKVVNIDETVPDYTDESNSAQSQDDFTQELNDDDQEYFDDDEKIELSDGNTTDRKLVISKDKGQGLYHYVSVR